MICTLAALAVVAAPLDGEPGSKCQGTQAAGRAAPTPADPYPLNAAGWGPEAGGGLQVSRWAEDWTEMHAAGAAPALKAVPIGRSASLTVSGELRVRYDVVDPLHPGGGFDRGLVRVVTGADLRISSNFRFYGEVAAGLAEGREDQLGANFRNDASLQQAFVEVRRRTGPALIGAIVGRQEFADGPRQLISLSDGPNLHRTWNGVRLFAHGEPVRLGVFEFEATQLERGVFDETVNGAERLRGLNASVIVSPSGGPNIYLEPFWYQSDNAAARVGGIEGQDRRDTVGARLWGRRGAFRFDWTTARQSGDFGGRRIDAWGVFAAQSWQVSERGWRPRLTTRLDIASGASGPWEAGGFNPLYASSNYLGEGQFLSLSNLVLATAGVSFAPTSGVAVTADYGLAYRQTERDAVYAGQARAYAGTREQAGRFTGGVLRIGASLEAGHHTTLSLNFERFDPGTALKATGLESGCYGYVVAVFRY